KEEEIKKLNEKLSQENPELYRQKAINVLTKKMEKWEIDENELSVDGENINTTQVDEINQKLTQFVGSTGAEKSLTKLLNQAQAALKSGQKTEMEKVKNALLDFLKSTNIYEKTLISEKESEINKMVENLENYSSQNAGSPSKQ
ncbi:13845_t:CDS:2, partial [Cetraspora pellucida]